MVANISGFALPAVRNTSGYFTPKVGIDAAWGDIILGVLTPRGSRFMRRSWGSDVADMLFMSLDSGLASMAAQYIRAAAAVNCPHVSIEDVTVGKIPYQPSTLEIAITFSLVTTGERATKSAKLDRSALMNAISTARY